MKPAIYMILVIVLSSCAAPRTLPRVDGVTHLTFRSIELETQKINSPVQINQFMSFFNSFLSKWSVPWYGPPVAQVHFDLYSGEKTVATFGISKNFITRTYGDFYSQTVDENEIRSFAESFHPALIEALYPILSDEIEAGKKLDYCKQQLSELPIGSSKSFAEQFLSKKRMEISYRSKIRWNIVLAIVNEGTYVNTAISAQLVFNEDSLLEKKRFFGYKLMQKPSADP